VQTVSDFLSSQFGYDAGGLGSLARTKYSKNLFGRRRLERQPVEPVHDPPQLRRCRTDVISDRTSSRFRFPNATYFFADETNSTVAQLNSTFGGSSYNEARVNFTTIRDRRASPGAFPASRSAAPVRATRTSCGAEQFSTANSLDQDIPRSPTTSRSSATHTFGRYAQRDLRVQQRVHAERIRALLLPDARALPGAGPVAVLLHVRRGRINPGSRSISSACTAAISGPSARTSRSPSASRRREPVSDSPNYNPIVEQAVGFKTSATPDREPTISPRIGLNWQIGEGQQLRGGIGIFAGRTPYVWVSNAYGGTGIGQISLSCIETTNPATTCDTPFVADPNNQPTSFPTGGGAFETALTDPDFKAPRLWRATAGYDRVLPWGVRGTVEVLYSKTIEDVYYQNVNYIESGNVSPIDGRPIYKRTALP
jgi:hypothetical protein